MKLIDAYTALKQLKVPLLYTKDASAYFNISIDHAYKLLSRLSKAKQIIHIKHGAWVFPDIDPLMLPCLLTDPFPAYISLQTALYYHGMISQIPSVIYAISIARTRLYKTSIGAVSIHHVEPSFFFGYDEVNHNALLKMATPEKALLDIFYLSQTKSRLFGSLPEVELPKNFKVSIAKKMIDKIPAIRRRSRVRSLFSDFVEKV